jgi:HD-like signal output (HDOD) protein
MSEINWAAIREEALGSFTLAALPPTLKLPALPHAVTLFVERAKEPDAALRDLAKILETDTGLTVELLRHVNSAFYGARAKAGNVQQALSMLGLRQSKTFVVTTGMQAAVMARKSKLINQSSFWNASLQKALFAKEVAILLKTDVDTAFSGALLQDYLLPVLSNDLFDPYLAFAQQRDKQPNMLVEYEQKSFGWDHALAAACLASRWQLPDELICCMLFHHAGLRILTHPQLGRSPVAAVALSAMLPDQLRQQHNGLDQLQALGTKWPAFNLEALAQAVDEKHAELGLGMKNDFPLSRRCRPAAGDAASYSDGTLTAAASA